MIPKKLLLQSEAWFKLEPDLSEKAKSFKNKAILVKWPNGNETCHELISIEGPDLTPVSGKWCIFFNISGQDKPVKWKAKTLGMTTPPEASKSKSRNEWLTPDAIRLISPSVDKSRGTDFLLDLQGMHGDG